MQSQLIVRFPSPIMVDSIPFVRSHGGGRLTSIVIGSTSCLLPLFLLDFSLWSLDCLGEEAEGASETIETSPFVSVAAATEAVDLRGILELCGNPLHRGLARSSRDWSLLPPSYMLYSWVTFVEWLIRP